MKGQDILIVEDENIVALDMRMRLESMGYRVVDVVDTAALALERAAELKPGLVLMDIKLKGDQDGIEAATQLRERSEVPVIFVTAFTDERTLDRAKRASPYGYIVKPFHERELRIAIELAIYKHQYELFIRRAKDIAEESNRIKGDFLANMSHELKTPLNSVIGFTELAMSSAKDSDQRENLAIALSSAKSLLTLIDSILDFARMEAGKMIAVSAPFPLDEILDECVDSLAIAVFPKGLRLTMRRDPEIPETLVGDASLLKHVILNLLDNAVKFTDSGSVRLVVSLHEWPKLPGSGPVLRFEVSDTGMGMPKEKIGLAFDRFSQLDPSTTRRAGGTGLGLAIVAKSVELMGGEISVESETGRGSRFTLLLPFEMGTGEGVQGKPAAAAERAGVALVGFDGEGFADASLVLTRLGYMGLEAASLEEATASPTGYIIADESILAEVDEGILASIAPRLVIVTRLGGDTRSKFAGRGIAFASAPLRVSGLREAFGSRGASSSDSRKEAKPARAPAHFIPVGGILSRLAESLERSVDTGALNEVEREAKEGQILLSETGDNEGSKLAFAALLSARRGDIDAIRISSAKMREIERMREKEAP